MTQKIKETIIYTNQDEAVEAGEKLIENGFKFEGKGVYYKGNYIYQLGFNDTLPMNGRQIEIYEEIGTKKARKKGLIK